MEAKKILVTTQRGIPLGYQGENKATEIVFQQPQELLVQNLTLLYQRATDREPYPVPLTINYNYKEIVDPESQTAEEKYEALVTALSEVYEE